METLKARERELLEKKWSLEVRLRSTHLPVYQESIKTRIAGVEKALELTRNLIKGLSN